MNREAISSSLELDDCWNRIGVWSLVEKRCERLQEYIHCQNCPVYSRSGKQLLEREMPASYLDECTVNLSGSKEETSQNLVSAIFFRVGDEYYALSTLLFNEITHMRPIHSIPHRKNRILRGLINIRGELLLCFSLGSLFELTRGENIHENEHKPHERLIIIKQHNNRYSFPVSEILGVFRYDPETLSTTPSTLPDTGSSYITGVLSHNQKQVGCLDAELLVSALDRTIG